MENLIVIEDGIKQGFDTIEDLVKVCINSNYYSMNEEKRYTELEKMATANAGLYSITILKWKESKEAEKIKGEVFVCYDEITHILSLAKIGKIVILEKTKCNMFTKYIDKTNIEDNYVIVNKFADEILSKYLNDK